MPLRRDVLRAFEQRALLEELAAPSPAWRTPTTRHPDEAATRERARQLLAGHLHPLPPRGPHGR